MSIKENVSLYKSLGFSIIPLIYKSKHPLVSWKGYQTRHPTDAELEEWLSREPRNIGVVTGTISGNLAVLDFDEESFYCKFFTKHEELEKITLVVKPSRGSHVYLKNDQPIRSFKIPELKLDVKAEGSFVVVPPSVHPSGHVYSFINPEVREVAVVSDLENMIWKRAAELGVKKWLPTPIESKLAVGGTHYRGEDPVCIKAILKGVQYGSRDEAAVRLARYLHIERGYSTDETLHILLEWNHGNIPPVGQHSDDPGDIERYFMDKIRSAEKTGRFGCASLSRIAGICCGRDQCEFFKFTKRRKKKWSITISR